MRARKLAINTNVCEAALPTRLDVDVDYLDPPSPRCRSYVRVLPSRDQPVILS
jgi:hypothetical protein